MKKYTFAVVGASGLVGRTFLKVIEEYDLPVGEIRLFASPKSVGKTITFKGEEHVLRELKEGCFLGVDYALFSAGAAASKEWGPVAEKEGAIVVDNSSFWRMDDTCALVVPEINIDDIKSKRKLVANPNCSTIQSVLPLKALEDAFGLVRVNYSTYQAVSGSGKKGLNDWEGAIKGQPTGFYPYDISHTCIPEIDVFFDDGYSKEEMKMVEETRKILHLPNLPVSATCIRVPVPVAHGVVIKAELKKEFTVEEARKVLATYPGIKVLDDPKNHIYPTSTIAAGNDLVYVGRIRKDLSVENGILLYCVADNVRKGAAANAVQIVKKLIEEKENA